ncbi:ABC transporter substrate-binding protein [Desulfocurvus sp.]|jgi:branched-chain amino acid transport system substrate-binding protein|uniref:ABC transporter substrate-binding protein n=1 Tax=Desulfocurvus sp. TaxID=2871698 RepID=UPI0025C705A1|nr:ABC transporter substrate-binding protein [Desulfocurvus sp.]MCK9239557.1 ABC transporter substrate-binding protein [Desulfocurvus sp.]
MKFGWCKAVLLACVVALMSVPAHAKTVKIACASAFSGPAAAYGDNVKAGVTLKVEEINAAGGVGGAQVEVLWMDSLCDPKESNTVAAKIARDEEIVGVVGHLCSSAHLAALPTYLRAGVPAITPTATNVAISDQNKDRKGLVWSFRDVYRDDFQGKFLARYAKEVLGVAKVAVFYENNDYGIGLKDAFVGEAKRLGLDVVGEEAYVKGTPDFTPQLTKLKASAPDGIFLSGYYNEGALIASQAKKIGLDVLKFGADGFDNMDYIKLAGDASEGTYITTPFLASEAGPEAQKFLADFKARYNRDVDYMSANAYDAAGILLQAIEKAGADRAKIREYLAGMNTPEKGYHGVSGLTYFDEHGDAQKPAFVKVVKNGEMVPAQQLK